MTRAVLLLTVAAAAVSVAVAAAPAASPHPGGARTVQPRAGPGAALVLAGVATGAGARAAPPSVSAEARDRSRWRWPLLPRPPVLRPFRAPESEYGRGHRGLDLAAEVGTPVLAVEGGVVTHAGVVAGRGTVTVRHPDGLSSTYEPVAPAVAPGAVVSVGDRLGTVDPRAGPVHCGARVCLHLGARRGDAYLDPHPLLVGGRVRLLPLG